MWSNSLLSRFYGRNYTWIGAVIFTHTLNEVGENKKTTRHRIIKHPYAEKPLPEESLEITKKLEGAKN